VVENVFTGNPIAIADTVTISDTSLTPVVYTITPNVTLVNEGDPVTFTITTTGVTSGTLVYWINVGTTAAADFSTTNNGSVAIQSGSASITRTATADLTTESEETIIIQLRSGSANGQLEVTSATVRVVDTSTTPIVPGYDVAASINSVNEGSSLTFTVTTTNVANGTPLYWSINNVTTSAGDFSTSNGTVNITTTGINGTGTFVVTPTADSTTDSSEKFTVSIRTVAGTEAQPVATSAEITIGDTSQTPAPYVPPYVPPYVAPTLAASATGPFYNFVVPGRGSNTKAYYIVVDAAPGGVQQSYSISSSLGLQTGFGSSSSGTFSGGVTRALVGFTGPHAAGLAFVTVSAPGYASFSTMITIPDNGFYTPFDVYSGFTQVFNRTGSALNLAYGIAEGLYRSNGAYTVDYNDGLGPRVRYGQYRDPDAGGVDYWTGVCIQNGWNWDTPAMVTAFIQTCAIAGDTRHLTSAKSYAYGQGWGYFAWDRP
jgi:hypothetical protein